MDVTCMHLIDRLRLGTEMSVWKIFGSSLGLRFGFHSLLVAVSLFFLGGRRRRHPRERRVSIIDRLFPFHDTAARHRGSN